MTPRGVVVAFAALGAWFAGRFLGVDELFAVAVALAAVLGLGVLYVRLATSQLSTRRLTREDRTVAGSPIEATLELRNDAKVPSPTMLVDEALPEGVVAVGQRDAGVARFVVGGVFPGRVAAARYRAIARTRGRYTLGPATVRLRDPLGVAERVRRYSTSADVLVYPAIERLAEGRISGAHMGSGSSDTRRVFATGDEFYTMREYVRGDDLRHVHWPSTAHRQTLMVRQMEQSWQAHATVLLDLRQSAHTLGEDGSLERVVSVGASLVFHLADRDYVLRLLTDRSAGRVQAERWEPMLDRLALIQPGQGRSLAPAMRAAAGGEGLFVAVVGTPAGSEPLTRHDDVVAMRHVKGFMRRAAIIVSRNPGEARARAHADLLTAMGWRTAVLDPGEPLQTAWDALRRTRNRPPVSATSLPGGIR